MADLSLLDRPVYTYAQVDRLLGLTSGTARRWINGYPKGGVFHEPVIRPDSRDSTWVRWGEYVEARLLRGWRDVDDVPLTKLRRLASDLRRKSGLDYPLAHYSTLMRAVGRTMVWEAQRAADIPDGLLIEVGSNQVLAPFVDEFIGAAKFGPDVDGRPTDDEVVGELVADPDFPLIRLNPRLRGGEPTIEGRSVRAATISDLVHAGERIEDVADWYDLTRDEVRQAVGYTESRQRIA